MSIEQEIKLAVKTESALDLEKFEWLTRLMSGNAVSLHLANTYFDTPDKALMRFGAGLRLREINGDWLQTVKCNGEVVDGLHQRPEWEHPLAGPEFDRSALTQTAIAELVDDDALWATLEPVFTTDFNRQIYLLHIEQSIIELAYDRGVVKAGNQQRPIHEIELELKQGEIEHCRQLAQQLIAHLPVQYSDTSKAAQGYQLAQTVENH